MPSARIDEPRSSLNALAPSVSARALALLSLVPSGLAPYARHRLSIDLFNPIAPTPGLEPS